MSPRDDEPMIKIDLRQDGSGEITIDSRRVPISTPSLDAAREQALAQVRAVAGAHQKQVRFVTHDPDGTWQLVMDAGGRVTEYRPRAGGRQAASAPTAPAPPAAPPTTPSPAQPAEVEPGTGAVAAPVAAPFGSAPALGDPSGHGAAPGPSGGFARFEGPGAGAPVAHTYDSGYVLTRLIPVTRIPKSTRGWRGLLGLRPNQRELEERTDRADICTPFGRPVTIVVADPRGGSGKTTTSLLLAGAFGNARGGGVLALENHELRGTMHLRTDAQSSSSTIRELLAAQDNESLAADRVRMGDLSRYVRHQVAGQYDVLVSATNSGRALRKEEFDQVHHLAQRMYSVIIVDTANNESAENWQAAIAKADALLVPLKWRNDYSLPAIEMLEELKAAGPAQADLVARAVVVASHGEGDLDSRCRAQLQPYFARRTQAIIEIPPDRHIAEGNAILHDQLTKATRRQSERMAAEVAKAIRKAVST
jgi:cellulose biosynthesis protein BcsQ